MKLVIKNLIKKIDSQLIIDNVDFITQTGDFITIYGESGAGKTTFLNCLAGIDQSDQGIYQYNNQEYDMTSLKEMTIFRNQNIAFIFQEYHLFEELTVYDNLKAILRLKKTDERQNLQLLCDNVLKNVGIYEERNKKVSQLSGGQKQRCGIARALLVDSDIIVADEPTGNLDRETAREILDLLITVAKDKILIIVTHDEDIINQSDKSYEMCQGKLILQERMQEERKNECIDNTGNFEKKAAFFFSLMIVKINQMLAKKTKYFLLVLSFLFLTLSIIVFSNLSFNNNVWFTETINNNVQIRSLVLAPRDYVKTFNYQEIKQMRAIHGIEMVIPEYTNYFVQNNEDVFLEYENGKLFNHQANLRIKPLKDEANLDAMNDEMMLIGKVPPNSMNNQIAINSQLQRLLGFSNDEVIGKEIVLHLNIPQSLNVATGEIETKTILMQSIISGVFRNGPAEEVQFGGMGDANIALPIELLNSVIEETLEASQFEGTRNDIISSRKLTLILDDKDKMAEFVKRYEQEYDIDSNIKIIETLENNRNMSERLFGLMTYLLFFLLIVALGVINYYEFLQNKIMTVVLKTFGATQRQIFFMSFTSMLLVSGITVCLSVISLSGLQKVINHVDIGKILGQSENHVFFYDFETTTMLFMFIGLMMLMINIGFSLLSSKLIIAKTLKNRQ